MNKTRDDSVKWLSFIYKGEFSELGKDVAFFLDSMWGLHNLNRTSLNKIDWANDVWIVFNFNHPISTVDNNDLTRLVVLAHQMMLRISVRGIAPGYIELMFHKRTTRAGSFCSRCPDIFDHVRQITDGFPATEATQ